MKWLVLNVLLLCVLPVMADEDAPSMEMLLFLADFVDEDGNWDGPDIEEEDAGQIAESGDKYE